MTDCNPLVVSNRLPTVFVSHGGGPMYFIDGSSMPTSSSLKPLSQGGAAHRDLEKVPSQLNITPLSLIKSILVVTAHWEGNEDVKVSGAESYKSLLYDYGGFPAQTYKLTYNAPTNPQLAQQVVQLLRSNGISASIDKTRGWDHGVFIPLKVMFPNADIPVVAMSILSSYDPQKHISIGQALSSLRDEGVLIIGSGFITHDFNLHRTDNYRWMDAITPLLTQVTAKERMLGLLDWESLPSAREVHAHEDHLMPLHVVVGAAGEDQGVELSRFSFGQKPSWTAANYAFGLASAE